MHKRVRAVGIALLMILLGVHAPGWAAPLVQARSVITNPTDGMTISGVVNVTGIATHPNMRFYQLRFAAGPQPTGDSQWVDFAIVEGAQVENDVLAAWDTTIIPDGQYTLALAVWGLDDAASPYVFFVTNLTVNNAQPVETPTPEPPTPEPTPTAVVGPTATPVSVEQPPTATSSASPTPESGFEEAEEIATPSAGEEEEGFSLPIDFVDLRSAFLSGSKVALLLFLLWAIYLFVKALVRWLLRQRVRKPWK
jgi:hypothetical protein